MKLAPILLEADQIRALEQAAATGKHPRERRRAQAVLSHSRGLTLQQLAAAYLVGRDTVRLWLTLFEQGGVAALAEGARCGRPPKLDAAAKKSSGLGGHLLPAVTAAGSALPTRVERALAPEHVTPRLAPGRLPLEAHPALTQTPA